MALDIQARMLIEQQCTALCYRAMYCLDTRQVDAFADLLTEDAELISELASHRGRENIRAWLGAGRGGNVSRHIITNLHFVDVEEDEAHAIGLNTSLLSTVGYDEPVFTTAKVFELHDRYLRTDAGWRLRSRHSTLIYGPKDWINWTKERMAAGRAHSQASQASG